MRQAVPVVRIPLRGLVLGAPLCLAAAGCAGPAAPLPVGTPMELVLTAGSDTAGTGSLGALDPARDGVLEIWVRGSDGQEVSAGRFTSVPAAGRQAVTIPFTLPIAEPRHIAVTLEPPGDADATPSPYRLLEGDFSRGEARLSVTGVITDGRELERYPGAHSLFTSSNNAREGYPSEENAGLWMFSMTPYLNKHKSRYVKVTPLTAQWIYEGWIVYRQGTADECWISHGKFRPDLHSLLTSRDNTGSGPFSGDEDYVNGGIEDVPGDEWTVDILGLPVPCGLQLPLQLDAVDSATGKPVWTHVMTIEPAFQESEPLLSEKPFILRPYWNEIGAGPPGDPRTILFQDNVLWGVARPAG